jgi:protocatechuate 3,4-dioxygenase beta subunit
MKRRKFIHDSSLLAFSVGVFGTIKWDGNSYVGNDPTTTDILGPFYRPGAPFRVDLVQPGAKGDIVQFSGTIFGKDGKSPVKDALVEIWHCSEDGVYDNTSDDYIYRASLKTGADGKYHFRTILPVPYQAGATSFRPAHFHMRISGTQLQDLVTQVYFKGDKHISEDMSSSDPRSLNRILDIGKNDRNEKVVKFDIFLREKYVLDAAAFKKITGLYQMSDKLMAEFYKDGEELFAKVNGQITEAMEYKGNNKFEGGLGLVSAQFELLSNGGAKVKVEYINDDRKTITLEGNKILKYPA